MPINAPSINPRIDKECSNPNNITLIKTVMNRIFLDWFKIIRDFLKNNSSARGGKTTVEIANAVRE